MRKKIEEKKEEKTEIKVRKTNINLTFLVNVGHHTGCTSIYITHTHTFRGKRNKGIVSCLFILWTFVIVNSRDSIAELFPQDILEMHKEQSVYTWNKDPGPR